MATTRTSVRRWRRCRQPRRRTRRPNSSRDRARRAQRHLRLRHNPLRDVDRPAGVPGKDARATDRGGSDARSGAGIKAQPTAPPALDYLVKRCLTRIPATAPDGPGPGERAQVGRRGKHEGRDPRAGGGQPKETRSSRLGGSRGHVDCWRWAWRPPFFQVPKRTGTGSRTLPGPEHADRDRDTVSAVSRRALAGREPGRHRSNGVVALPLDAVTPQILARENNVTQPFWSPDSRSLAFYEEGRLKRIDVGGGPAQIICDAPPPHSVGDVEQRRCDPVPGRSC